jgi:serine/threonine protein kinase
VSQTSHARSTVTSSFLLNDDQQNQLVKEAQQTGGKIRISALDLFWKKIPVIANPKSEDIFDFRDGAMVKNSDLKSACAALMELRQVWTKLDPRFATTWTAIHLPEMAKICLILQAIDKRIWIESFIAAKKDDSALTLNQQELETILSHSTLPDDDQEEKDYAIRFFLGEQYRVKPRDWTAGAHAELYDLEPLPLEYKDSWPDTESGYATVTMVKEVGQGAHRGEIFAHKKGKLKESTPHLTNEFQCLKVLGDHTHIVQCVKTYCRGEEFGLLIKPVAEHNLWKLLGAYCDWRYKKHRALYRKTLLQAFGCLSSSLVFIHETTRHKDIKPQNILWYKPKEANDKRGKIPKSDLSRPTGAAEDETPREQNVGEVVFLWADFGLAHNFSAKSNAKTYGGHQGTGRYSGPEYRTSDSITAHDKSSDVFALGCVFLEILSVLLKATMREEDPGNIQHILASETVPPDGHNQGTDTSSATLQDSQKQFRHKLPAIDNWVGDQLSQLDPDDLLVPLLIVSRRMIREKPEKRPGIKEVVRTLFAESDEYFCKECCSRKEELLKQAASSRPAVRAPTAPEPSIQPQAVSPQTAPPTTVPVQAASPSIVPTQIPPGRISQPQAPKPQASQPQSPQPEPKEPRLTPRREEPTGMAEASGVERQTTHPEEIGPPLGKRRSGRPQSTQSPLPPAQPAKANQQRQHATLAPHSADEKSSRRKSWFWRSSK